MSRVATFGNYQSALLDLMKAQTRGAEAQQRVSTQKVATTLEGFGRQSETLTALRGAESRLTGFIDASKAVAARLTTQDLALNQVNDGINGVRAAIADALSSDSGITLMVDIEGQFQSIRGGLNMRHQGSYLFSGAATSTLPMAADTLTAAAAAPTAAALFSNDTLKTASRVAEGATLETGFLADDVGTEVMTILRDIQTFHTGPDGPLTGKLTEAQRTFLTAQIERLEAASNGVVDRAAKTGSMANQVDRLIENQTDQVDALTNLIGERTNADMAQAITDLEMSQIAIEASAQVISQLRQVSLLNFLR